MNAQTEESKAVRYSNAAIAAAGPILVLLVAAAGWSLSYRALHDYGVQRLGETESAAWLVPLTFSLAPLGLSLIVYQAKQKARSAWVWRLGIWVFSAIEAGINYINAPAAYYAREIAAALPVSAVILFEGLMWLTHKRALERMFGDKVIPKLTIWCWLLDFKRTAAAFKTKQLRPLAAAEVALQSNTAAAAPISSVQTPSAEESTYIPPPANMPTTKQERIDRVMAIIQHTPTVTAEVLANQLGVSRATAARDLRTIRG